MEKALEVLVCRVGEERYALPLDQVAEVVHAVHVTPLPAAPPGVLGIINVGGCVVPVIDLRRRFGLPVTPLAPEQCFVLENVNGRRLALLVDEALTVMPAAAPIVSTSTCIGFVSETFPGALLLDDGVVLIHDLDRLLSLEDAVALGAALDGITTDRDGLGGRA